MNRPGERKPGVQSESRGLPADWRFQASCRGQATRSDDPWDADPYTSQPPQRALSACERCPVRRTCLIEGLKIDQANDGRAYGIWGGLAPKQRRALVRARKRLRCPICGDRLIDSNTSTLIEICYACGISWKKHRSRKVTDSK